MALRTGWQAAADAWRGDTADTEATRATRYGVLWGFYLNDPYDELVNDYAQRYKSDRALYQNIEPLYNPVTRLVEFYVAKVVGGTLDPMGEAGALPIADASPEVREAITRVWNWSNWANRKSLWVRYGAALGDSVLKVIEDRDADEVALRVHWPGDLVDTDFDRSGRVTYAVFEYTAQERDEAGNVDSFTYKEVITPEEFATFKDDRPWDYVNGKAGGDWSKWENEFGFVPVVVTRHKDSGHAWGLCCYHNGLGKIDALNDLASHLGDQIRKAIHPQWISFGAKAGQGLERSDKIWHHPNPEGRVEALVEQIDIAAVTAEIQARLREIERDFPELKAYQMADKEMSGRAVKLLLGDVIDRVTEARGQYDASLVMANQMALRIGAHRELWVGSLKDDFEHRIGTREIFPVDEGEALDLEVRRLSVDAQRSMLTGS